MNTYTTIEELLDAVLSIAVFGISNTQYVVKGK
jgi:hypothetical protein